MYIILKRTEDILMAIAVLIFALPIMLLTAISLRLSGISPVMFFQTRSGKGGKPFKIYKFRTMTDERDADGNILPDELRATKFGRIVRKLSLDELPQVLNVLKGDMSFVGPRPLFMEYNKMYSDKHRRRLDVLPGITGYTAVHGRSDIPFSRRFDMDVFYVDNASFLLDNKIIFMTFIAVFLSKGSPAVTDIDKIDDLGFIKRMKEETKNGNSPL